ncbi:hypothetical protein BT69DRAFT_470987 [Atractiella rhizophila]|nr:hypothetical protein BT69DRAFT_470987 [Atractiella rhizophila]
MTLPSPLHPLAYSIYSTSPFSSKYPPENILDNLPLDQTSRWSAASSTMGNGTGYSAGAGEGPGMENRAEKWIVIKLEKRAVAVKGGWGKFYKAHPCNVRTFRLWGSLDDPPSTSLEGAPHSRRHPPPLPRNKSSRSTPTDTTSAFQPSSATNERLLNLRREPHKWILLHEGNLRNDERYEEFEIRWRDEGGRMCPVQYVKIEPLVPFCHQYNMSIWFFQLLGLKDDAAAERAVRDWEDHVTTTSLHLALKFLRHHTPHLHSLQTTLSSLITTLPPFPSRLDHPFLSKLWEAFVVRGDFTAAETMLEQACEEHHFFNWLSEEQGIGVPTAFWRRLHTPDVDGDVPCRRGGHGMVYVPPLPKNERDGGKIVLFGGWTGTESLCDLWEWKDRWECVTRDTRTMKGGGPGPRSIHRMVVDSSEGAVYVLGRYLEEGDLDGVSDMWRYWVWERRWEQLSWDTEEDGGPPLLQEHQMVFDEETKSLYVFGGKLQNALSGESKDVEGYSGMYKYDVERGKWTCIFKDAESSRQPSGRIGHSMLLDPVQRLIYIFSGQTGTKFRRDTWVYAMPPVSAHSSAEEDKPSSRLSRLDPTHDPFAGGHGNVYGSIGRATIDHDTGEWTLMSGIEPQIDPPFYDAPSNKLWVRLKTSSRTDTNGKWIQVGQGVTSDGQPPPRFAHQLVYDQASKVHYLFGGNPVDDEHVEKRLGDFWALVLVRQTPQEILRKVKFHLRKQRFMEMCASEGASIDALSYLQESLGSLVNHQHEGETEAFRSLMALLLESSPTETTTPEHHGHSRASSEGTDDDESMAGSHHTSTSSKLASSSMLVSPTIGGLGGGASVPDPTIWKQRTNTYETLMEFFPEGMKEPKQSLQDFVTWKGLPPLAT